MDDRLKGKIKIPKDIAWIDSLLSTIEIPRRYVDGDRHFTLHKYERMSDEYDHDWYVDINCYGIRLARFRIDYNFTNIKEMRVTNNELTFTQFAFIYYIFRKYNGKREDLDYFDN